MKEAWFLAHEAATPQDLPDVGWRQVALPHQWGLDPALQDMERKSKAGWYRLEPPEAAVGRRWIEIWADYQSQVWFSGVDQGIHRGYFDPWLLEIPPGQTVAIRVSPPEPAPGGEKRQLRGALENYTQTAAVDASFSWRGQGGLWGGARYFRTGETALLHASWRTAQLPQGWKLWIEVEMDYSPPSSSNPDLPLPLPQETLRLQLKPENFSGEVHTTERTIELTAGRGVYSLVWDLPPMALWEVWERGFPSLYELTIERTEAIQGEHRLTYSVGFRTFTQEGDWLVLNDRPLFLRGANVIPSVLLADYDDKKAEKDLNLIREAHLNAVRLYAHVTHPAFYAQCDRKGVLVWQDFPLLGEYAEEEALSEEAVRQAQAMVRRYGNHPCIYLWCAHTEPGSNRYRFDPLLVKALQQADSTRLILEAATFRSQPFPGWRWGHYHDFLAVPGAPIPAAFGAQALSSLSGETAWPPDWEVWQQRGFESGSAFLVAGLEIENSLEQFTAATQDYQAQLIRFAIGAYRCARGRVTGYFQFLLIDPSQDLFGFGVLDVDRQPKKGYFALKEASAPLFLYFPPYREFLEPGQFPLSEVWVINDLERSFQARFKLLLEGAETVVLVEDSLEVPASASTCIFQTEAVLEGLDGKRLVNLQNLGLGEAQLIGEIWEGETLLARSERTVWYQSCQPGL